MVPVVLSVYVRLTHCPQGDGVAISKRVISKHMSRIGFMKIFFVKLLSGECHRIPWWWINIGSGNGLVPAGNKPLPEPILTQIYVIMSSLGHNKLTLKSLGHTGWDPTLVMMTWQLYFVPGLSESIHCPQVTFTGKSAIKSPWPNDAYILYISKLGHHCFTNGWSLSFAPSHYLNVYF